MRTLRISRRLACVIGTVTPLLELVRRREQLTTPGAFPLWFDDVLLGAFLLYGAWRVGQAGREGQATLAAAWGFMIGLAYYSFFTHLQQLASPDPSGLRSIWIVTIKGIGLVLGVAGLIAALAPVSGPDAVERV